MTRVLVVDDEPNILLSLEFLMQQAGFDVATAEDGERALASVAEQTPEVILLDISLPGISGFDVLERLRADPAHATTPIIMLTAHGREVEREKGLALGADDYITKPFSTRDLVEKVQALLASRKSNSQGQEQP
ncbi:MAG: response regulator transcription factor [Halomonas sp.]|uniref:response regulator transcription factor n=1 Tax=Halomonas sp. TaxID=1486246 RepID=UPI003F9267F5